MRSTTLLILISCISWMNAIAQGLTPIGNWTDHLSYNQAISIKSIGDKIYTATPNGLFSIDQTNNVVERLSKLIGLSTTGISSMGSSESTIIIGYLDGNIDLIKNGSIININSIHLDAALSNKTIYDIVVYNDNAYLSTGFGVVVVSLSRNEISETYIIGEHGATIAVYSFAKFKAEWYALTPEGIKKAPVDGMNLQDYNSWKPVTTEDLSGDHSSYQLIASNHDLYYRRADTIWTLSGNTVHLFYTTANKINAAKIVNLEMASLESTASYGEIKFLNVDGTISRKLTEKSLKIPRDIIVVGDDYYIADSATGLIQVAQSGVQVLNPSSPYSSTITAMTQDRDLIVTANLPTSFSIFQNREWTSVDSTSIPLLIGNNKILTLAFDPTSRDLWAGSANDGLLQRTDAGNFIKYKEGSFISPSISNTSQYTISGIAFDIEANMWISNSGATENLVVKKSDGQVIKFEVPFNIPGKQLGNLIIDDINQKWIKAAGANGLICFNSGTDLVNKNDDQWKLYSTGIGNGNLPANEVLSIAKDKNNFIWVGTSSGIGIIQCPELVFTNQGCDAVLPIVKQGNFNGYLFAGERVQAITVDAADRKWVGTTNGIWLISPDGEKILSRLTSDNSPLPDNDIRHITIYPGTGDVFIATSKGLCSYRGTATETGTESTKLLVFPNPVPPGYTGTIGITGVPSNSIVKITELNGRLVFQGRSNGNMFTWNGLDSRGQKISTGVYLVLLTDQQRKESLATKIIFISR